MIAQSFYERYLEIQSQILDKKIFSLKERVKNIKSDVFRELRLQSILLERKKNRIIREYRITKESKTRSYDQFVDKLNGELQDLCKLYNNLFNQLESYK